VDKKLILDGDIMVASGDTSEYTVSGPGGACVQTFERLPQNKNRH